MKTSSSRIVNTLLSITSVIVIIFALEIFLRTFGYAGDYEREQLSFSSPYTVVRKDSWVLNKRFSENIGKSIMINEAEYNVARVPWESRYLFLGDSITQGWGVNIHRAFPALFEHWMRQSGIRMQSINAGVYGLNTYDEYSLYSNQLSKLKPDTVILGLFLANDINFNLVYSDRLTYKPKWLIEFWKNLLDASALAHFLYLKIFLLNQEFRFASGNTDHTEYFSRVSLIDKQSGLHMLNYREGELIGYLSTESALMSHAYQRLEYVLSNFQKDLSESKTRFLVVLIPGPPSVVGHYYSPIEPNILMNLADRGIKIDADELDLTKPARQVLNLCTRLKIECIDTTLALRPLGQMAFIPHDDHLSELGRHQVAHLLLNHILPSLQKKTKSVLKNWKFFNSPLTSTSNR